MYQHASPSHYNKDNSIINKDNYDKDNNNQSHILHIIKHQVKIILTETKVASELGSQHPVQAAHSQVLALHPRSYLGSNLGHTWQKNLFCCRDVLPTATLY